VIPSTIMPEPAPIVVLCGFLGSGKTTLLRQWRAHEGMRHAAVIVQDLSELGVDVELVNGDQALPAPGTLGRGRVAALHGRHAREDLHRSLGRILGEIADLEPPADLVLLESTGAARPWPLLSALAAAPGFHLRHFLVVVDALNLHRDHGDGTGLEHPEASDPALALAAAVLREQLAFANVIVLAKIDLVPGASWRDMVAGMQRINPGASVALSAHAGLSYGQLEALPPPDPEALRRRAVAVGSAGESGQATAEGIDSMIFRDRRPFHPGRLHDACQSALGTGLFRTKGFLWLASRPGDVLLWQQSGSQISLEFMGWWRAELALNRDGKLLPEEVEPLRERMRSADPVFGDRQNEQTLIGLPAPRDGFAQVLQEYLCTEEEIRVWQAGAAFEDPWTTRLRPLS